MIRTRNGRITLVLGNRQLLLGIAMLMTLMWTFALVTFSIARIAFPVPAAADQEPMEPIIVVESPVLSDAPAELRMVPEGTGDLPPQPPPARNNLGTPAPAPVAATYLLKSGEAGRIYLQVAAVRPDLAKAYTEYLTSRAIPAFTSDGATADAAFVMVGPVRDAVHMAKLQTDLVHAGFELD